MNKLEIWCPDTIIDGPFHLTKFNYLGKLSISFENENGQEITFTYNQNINGRYILASRFTDEMKRGDLVNSALKARENYAKNLKAWYLYKVTDSDFIKWYDDLSGPGSDYIKNIEHHIYSGSEDTFEVLSEYEPEVTVKNI
ncbi:hypothetical protein SAMN04489762_0156 [Terribacillus saccharophilus]|uniref:Uncharacterized protein n=1 Tax=Terribacillus saccharophilus TaxID=361277 RepID=A0AAX2E940_9BACI|nr:hypothetical protein SAMN04489762_0156 [Terribacillus saccharophilus]